MSRKFSKEVDDAFDESVDEVVTEIKEQEQTPYNKWEKWWELCSDHPVSPQSYQAWDGAINTLCHYLTNELCGESGMSLDEIEALMEKAKKKFKVDNYG